MYIRLTNKQWRHLANTTELSDGVACATGVTASVTAVGTATLQKNRQKKQKGKE